MKKYQVKKYTTDYYSKWNEFVANAKNATFLFHRDFMEYHSDRFEDYSLLVFDEKENLKAILPANRVGDILYSHQGLTYGGLVLNSKSKLSEVIFIIKSVLKFLCENDIKTLELKQIPTIYNDFPSDEMEYILFILEAKLIRKDSLSTIKLEDKIKFTKTRRESISRGFKNNLKIIEDNNLELFWNDILIPNLNRKHQVKPVHTIEEIKKLMSIFPEKIRHFNVYHNDRIVAGTMVFITKNVAHPQYISGNKNKNELGSLDYLYNYLITDVFKDKKYFDFGISNENNGKNINEGLLFWKESFGARTIVQNFYAVETKNFNKLETILI